MAVTITFTLTNRQAESCLAVTGISAEEFYPKYSTDHAIWCKRRIKEREKAASINVLSTLNSTQLSNIVASMPSPESEVE
jgi:hypothetical protein